MKKLKNVKSFEQYVNENYAPTVTPVAIAQPLAGEPAEDVNEFLTKKADPSAAKDTIMQKLQELGVQDGAIKYGMRADNEQASAAKMFNTTDEFAQAVANKGVDKGKFVKVKLSQDGSKFRMDFVYGASMISKIAAGSGAMTVGENVDGVDATIDSPLAGTEADMTLEGFWGNIATKLGELVGIDNTKPEEVSARLQQLFTKNNLNPQQITSWGLRKHGANRDGATVVNSMEEFIKGILQLGYKGGKFINVRDEKNVVSRLDFEAGAGIGAGMVQGASGAVKTRRA